ncbi:Calx-beta domain-containing protein [Thauera sinica]|uniref:Calx-beta domain-containing protein n=1 Tax=Thauera sp. K11 TaxID=2005884 RepID=UPI000BBB09C2|nr:Calx-beta domain-containing protein [Thauera sp. K11]ATE59369.1 hypothetical protein CCZ27_04870 [Thauera sp. K11]
MGRILDDDAGGGVVPVISIEPAQVLESNSTYSPTMEFVVRLSAPTTQTVRVSYATVAGTALAGSDYVATSGTLTFAPGQTSAVIVVTPYGGTAVEPDETFVLRLTNPQNAALAGGVAALDAIGTIIDNDAPAAVDGLPILSVADVQVQEAPGGATAVFTLNLSSPTAAAVSGQFAVVAGTASAGADFTPVSGTFLIEPGQSAFTVEVPILDDALDEPTETFVLRLSEISNAGFAGTDTELWAIGEIVDDDVTPGVAVAAGGDLEVAEGQAFGRTVNFTDGADAGANGWTYEIDWDGDGLADETGSLAPGNSSFDISHVYPDGPAATVVTVKVIDEAGMDEASASFTVAVTNVAPVIALTGAGSVDEGSAYMLNFGTLADPGADAATEFAALGGNASHTYADDGNYGITLSVTDEDGSFVAGSKSVTVEGNVLPPETVRIGEAPTRVTSGNPNAIADAWLGDKVSAIVHKADATDTGEAWSAVNFSGTNATTLAGVDHYSGDLGVSGQSAATSSVRQEIDGREVLRIELGQAASKVTVDLSRFYLNDDGTLHAESGRLRLLDASGNVVDEATFVADSTTGGKTVSLDSTADFTAVEISAGAYDGTDFVFGAYAGAGGGFATGVYADGAGLHGSDFLVNWVEFEFQPVGTLQPNPLDL